ncbi:MAG: Trk system potassium transporter TrkA [Lentimicrobiaceae bacterium]|jgi:trk system potassium uptake protein TrkA|nr:Trk system potassium transporter TrkA [Lentimicrobiaceae bacterium]MCP4910380.1 Trk system potassium transporter TrkA [Bacteroidota bacterium]MBT3454554.1 Trk system potassium transporter TrkA [Lentimicrobiaceae bacterium]MBT3818148.1 Trk system potassium transporter TrkA [Lentimicrobiaceae bacterium]MBT4061433.1 Trk system potassium transporter TrkA [Lentimicrobiaceae bacterium]
MNIIIAGDGEVGFYLAEALVHSNHNITIVDPHEELLKLVESHADLMTIVGQSNSVAVLKKANVAKADLVISVLHSEEINILTAIIAKKLGAKYTIARVNTMQNLALENQKTYNELGIDQLLSPEDIAGHEVVKLLQRPAAIEIFDLSDGQLQILLIKINDDANAVNQSLNDIANQYENLDFRAVAIHRGNSTFIPSGDTIFQPNDFVYVITKPEGMEELMKLGGKQDVEINNIMLIGGGRVGKVIAKQLETELNIKLIEQSHERSLNLIDLLNDTLIINGDARDIKLLEEEGIEGVDAFIAVTNNSETNIITCLHAKKFGVKKTIALVENLDYIEISKNIGIDTIINKKLSAASYMIKHSMGDEVSSLKCLSGISSDVVEFIAKRDSAVTKKLIRNLKMPEGSIIGGVIRGNKSYIAIGDFQIEEDDKVVVFALPGLTHKLEKIFHKQNGGLL